MCAIPLGAATVLLWLRVPADLAAAELDAGTAQQAHKLVQEDTLSDDEEEGDAVAAPAAAGDDNRGRHGNGGDGGPAAVADYSNSIHAALADDSNGTQI